MRRSVCHRLVATALVVGAAAVVATAMPLGMPLLRASAAPTPPSGPTATVGVGGTLPSEATCAGRVIPMNESRPGNAVANRTRGTPNSANRRVTGNYVGSTDEILQWAACKWGFNVSWLRSQSLVESSWRATALGDFVSDPSRCAPGHPIGVDGRPGLCPQSIGMMQIGFPWNASAFENRNAERSTAYNLDYALALWRDCYEGKLTWLNNVERGGVYAAGDGLGCIGVWNTGRWRTPSALAYIDRVTTTRFPAPTPSLARPPAPLGFAATPYASGRIQLRWVAPTSGVGSTILEYGYQISTDGITWRGGGAGPASSRSVVIGGLVNGQRYFVKLGARNVTGWGAITAPIVVTPRPMAPPAPTSFAGRPAGPTSVRLTWAPPADDAAFGIIDYGYQISTDGVTWRGGGAGPASARSVVIGGLRAGTRYHVRLAARNAVGWGAITPPITVIPGITAPSVPRSVTATAIGPTTVELDWLAPDSDGGAAIVDYGYQISTDGITWRGGGAGPAGTTTSIVTGLTPGTTYRFRLAARNSVGWGTISPTVSITTPLTAGRASAPTPPVVDSTTPASSEAPTTPATTTDTTAAGSSEPATASTLPFGTTVPDSTGPVVATTLPGATTVPEDTDPTLATTLPNESTVAAATSTAP